ncbi:XRE family transcriptional regulator [Cryobacterium frigoriphilum]|uniref:XRE family transcriptional regulator n=1 Tax=Cryobacterium frigoriphilum TaxID=1259150 RepID=A0A4R8ZTD5_9MICO|nr:XRE family transcriptional regulator [Cryobacterium frigoriphilum]TFD45128.1 XRE family transcriptional regulator [Cryobacterium frigoriphilum]
MPDPALDSIGPRLKSWRQKRSLTLDELSAATDISASTLSRLESGKRAPNLQLLVPIMRALRLELDDIVPRVVPDPRIDRVTKRVGEISYVELSPASSALQTYKVTLPATPSGVSVAPDPKVHDGYEWLYVLDGRLRLVLGQHDVVLGVGEAAEFDTRTPHWLAASGTGPVELLTIFSKQGTRIHLRARPAS